MSERVPSTSPVVEDLKLLTIGEEFFETIDFLNRLSFNSFCGHTKSRYAIEEEIIANCIKTLLVIGSCVKKLSPNAFGYEV